jgi:inner membrane protein
MPTPLTHAVVGASLVPFARASVRGPRLAVLLAAVAILPDLDLVLHRFGFHYGHMLSHRGLSHSVLFALATALLATWMMPSRRGGRSLRMLFLALTASLSHPLLDAMTDGGLGVGLLMPLVDERVFLPWRPIRVSPLRLSTFASSAAGVLQSEVLWVWLPLVLILIICCGARCVLRGVRARSQRRSRRVCAADLVGPAYSGGAGSRQTQAGQGRREAL